MAKKTKEAEFNPFDPDASEKTLDGGLGDIPVDEEAFPGTFDTEEGVNFETDFNLDDEYKPTPLAPKGNYLGAVSKVTWEPKNNALCWGVTLSEENEVRMTDGSPASGQVFDYRNWFPRPGDEHIMTPKGRQTKRQAKINMIKEFSTGMKIDMSSPKKIIDAVQNQDWLGIPVIVSLSIEQYEGRFRNNISKMVQAGK